MDLPQNGPFAGDNRVGSATAQPEPAAPQAMLAAPEASGTPRTEPTLLGRDFPYVPRTTYHSGPGGFTGAQFEGIGNAAAGFQLRPASAHRPNLMPRPGDGYPNIFTGPLGAPTTEPDLYPPTANAQPPAHLAASHADKGKPVHWRKEKRINLNMGCMRNAFHF